MQNNHSDLQKIAAPASTGYYHANTRDSISFTYHAKSAESCHVVELAAVVALFQLQPVPPDSTSKMPLSADQANVLPVTTELLS